MSQDANAYKKLEAIEAVLHDRGISWEGDMIHGVAAIIKHVLQIGDERIQALEQQNSELKRERDALREVLNPLVEHLKVGYNTNLQHLEIGGMVAFRPIEQPMKDKLGTLFTLLFNARAVLEPHAQSSQRSQDVQKLVVAARAVCDASLGELFLTSIRVARGQLAEALKPFEPEEK